MAHPQSSNNNQQTTPKSRATSQPTREKTGSASSFSTKTSCGSRWRRRKSKMRSQSARGSSRRCATRSSSTKTSSERSRLHFSRNNISQTRLRGWVKSQTNRTSNKLNQGINPTESNTHLSSNNRLHLQSSNSNSSLFNNSNNSNPFKGMKITTTMITTTMNRSNSNHEEWHRWQRDINSSNWTRGTLTCTRRTWTWIWTRVS